MNWRSIGLILLVAGVLCGILVLLLNFGGVSNTGWNNLLMYSGIIAIVVGLVVFGATSSRK
jgi:sugar phosphate permease